MKKYPATIALVVTLLTTVCLAGIRAKGKYSGVVIFDRWGGCTLYSGVYVMYIAQDIRKQLRPEAGKCVQIDATQVDQPVNPGDGLIRKLVLLGPAPPAKAWESPDGLKLTATRAFEDGSPPAFVIRIKNVSDKPRTLYMDSLAPTLLAAKSNDKGIWGPSGGPSVAVVTRTAFWIDGPRMQEANGMWKWKVVAPRRLEKEVTLDPGSVFEIRLSFAVPAGEYDFLAGYGGGVHAGRSIASNLIAFDVRKDGTAVLAKVDEK